MIPYFATRARITPLLVLLVGTLGSFVMTALAQDLPQSVLLYEKVKDRLHVYTANGRRLSDVPLCRLAARCGEPQPFVVLPSDFEPAAVPCDASKLLLAFNGACTAGIVHPTHPHLAPSQSAVASCVQYGEMTVIYFNNVTKLRVPRTPEGEAAAVAWLEQIAAGLVVEAWSPAVDILPWGTDFPPHARR